MTSRRRLSCMSNSTFLTTRGPLKGHRRLSENASAEEFERGSAIHGSLEGFHPVHVTFADAGTPRAGKADGDGVEVLAEETGEALHRLRSDLLGLADPLQQQVYAEGWTAARKGGVARSR
jgi:hypothetical protein